jgi:hypothetical protein
LADCWCCWCCCLLDCCCCCLRLTPGEAICCFRRSRSSACVCVWAGGAVAQCQHRTGSMSLQARRLRSTAHSRAQARVQQRTHAHLTPTQVP